jgi:hypothetical protein
LVIVGNHHSRQFHVLVGDSLEHAIELADIEVETAKRLLFELPEGFVELMTNLVRHGAATRTSR